MEDGEAALVLEVIHILKGQDIDLSGDFKNFDFSSPVVKQFIPDFSRTPYKSGHFKHTLLGDVNTASYIAKLHDKRIEWVMAYDHQGRVWIDRISFLGIPINSYGISPLVIDSGALTNKPIEYQEYASALKPGEYLAFDEEYSDITPLLDNLLPIQLFRRARGIARKTNSASLI